MSTIVEDVLCPFCGCLCDDLQVEVEDNQILSVKKACKIGKTKIIGHDRIKTPMIRENGELKEASYEEAISKAAEILSNSKRPLLYGWSSTVCEAHKKGIELAEYIGAVIDNTASVCHGPSVIGIQTSGIPGCTLGQIKNRADLIVFWGCNPVYAHPRHTARYSYMAKGFFTPEGKKGRKLVVVDVRKTKTANLADEFLQIEPDADYVVLSSLRAIIAGCEDVVPESVGGLSKEKLIEVAEMMKNARFGVIFFGMGLTQTRGRYNTISNAVCLTRELCEITKFAIMPMRGHYNVSGFGQVLAWQAGYPFSVDFARGYPWYNPGEASAVDVLNRCDCDAALIVASDPGAHFPQRSVQHLARVPLIQIDPYANPTTELADVVIPCAVSGVEAEGTAYRMDKVPLRLRKIVETELSTDEVLLDKILTSIKMSRGDA